MFRSRQKTIRAIAERHRIKSNRWFNATRPAFHYAKGSVFRFGWVDHLCGVTCFVRNLDCFECQRTHFWSFVGVAMFGLGLSWLLVKFQSPPVRCCLCDAKGWIEDLTPDHFSCPVCNGDSFIYTRPRTTRRGHRIVPEHTEAISGKTLVSRAKGKFWD